MLAEILAYSKSALCRSTSLAFSFVSLRLHSFHLFIVDSVTEDEKMHLCVTDPHSPIYLTKGRLKWIILIEFQIKKVKIQI